MSRLVSAIVLLVASMSWSAAADFKTYDMSGLSWLPPSLQEAGYETIPVLYMCHMWNGRYGHQPTNCDNVDFSGVNHDVVRQRAEETLGEPLVVIDIEQTKNPTSHVWHLLSEDPEIVTGAVALWQELIATFREVNPDSRIMIYKPIPRIWWPMMKNRRFAPLKRGQSRIDARYETAKLIAPLFEDKSLQAWPSAYLTYDEPEILRLERQWQIRICKELYKTRCIFALTPWYQKEKNEQGSKLAVPAGRMLEVMNELQEDGADGFGFWVPNRYDNDAYLKVVRQWDEDREAMKPRQYAKVQWLTAIESFLAQEPAAAVE